MSLNQVNIVDPYVPWTGWGDYAFNDDVNAITEYIENQRPKIPKFPAIQKLIEDYEKWLVNLSWLEKYYTPDTSLGQAVWYRDRINELMGQSLNPSITTGDAYKKIVSVNPAEAKSFLENLFGQVLPQSLISTLKWAAIIATGGVAVYLFGPAIRNKLAQYSRTNDIIKGQMP